MTAEELLEVLLPLTQTKYGEYIGALKTEDGQFIEDAKEKVKSHFVDHIKAVGEGQYKRAERIAKGDGEKSLRNTFADYDLPADAQGEDLINALHAQVLSDRQRLKDLSTKVDKGDQLSLDDILAKEEVRQRISQKIKEATQTLEQKLAEKDTTYQKELSARDRKRKELLIARHIDQYASEYNIPVEVKGDKKLTERRRKMLLGLIDPDEVMEGEDGSLIPVDSKGEPLVDDTTYAKLDLASVFRHRNPFGEAKFSDTNSTPPPAGAAANNNSRYRFANGDEYMKARAAAKDDKQKLEISRAWQAQQAAQA